jgi:hypothetical protein
MNLTVVNGILVMCLEGIMICERNYTQPAIKYYEPGKSCYIEGVFYTSCPKREYK